MLQSKKEDRGGKPGGNLVTSRPQQELQRFSAHQKKVINEINIFKRNSTSSHIPLQ
jgi:hypothetical protein